LFHKVAVKCIDFPVFTALTDIDDLLEVKAVQFDGCVCVCVCGLVYMRTLVPQEMSDVLSRKITA
jgi:hypothetical protein